MLSNIYGIAGSKRIKEVMYRNFKHPILKNLNIIFDSGILVVWCQDTAETNCGKVAIIRCKFSVKKFEEITIWLDVK